MHRACRSRTSAQKTSDFTKITDGGVTPHGIRAVSKPILKAMKTNCRKKPLTFGELIAHVYDGGGERKAREIVRLVIKAHLIEFCG